MKLIELKNWVNNLPNDFNDFIVVRGDYGIIDDKQYYRVDKSLTVLSVDDEEGEILLLSDIENIECDLLDTIRVIVKTTSNDFELGTKIRELISNNE